MSIPHARRLPIPDLFKDPPLSVIEKRGAGSKSAISHSVSPSVTSSSVPGLSPSPPIPSSPQNCILPTPSEKKVKYASTPSLRRSKDILMGFVRPKSPLPPKLDQNASPVQTLGSASGDSTIISLTPPLSAQNHKESFTIFRETTNSLSPPLPESKTLIPHDDETPKEFPSFITQSVYANEEHVCAAIFTSIDGDMNMNTGTAHLETAVSLRSIRGTLNQSRKNRSHSRKSCSMHSGDIFIHTNENYNTKDTVEVSVSQTPAPETLSNQISQLVNIVGPRVHLHPSHEEYMATWSEMEIRTYNARWDKLVEKSKRVTHWPIARFSDIPWPVLPSVVISSSSPDLITRLNVTRFLICLHRDQDSTSLERIFAEIERWNDFQLMGRVLRNVRGADRKNVEMAWSRVVLVLMEMRGERMAGRRLF